MSAGNADDLGSPVGNLLLAFLLPGRAIRASRTTPILIIVVLATLSYGFVLGALPMPCCIVPMVEPADWNQYQSWTPGALLEVFRITLVAVFPVTAFLAGLAHLYRRAHYKASCQLRGVLLSALPTLWLVLLYMSTTTIAAAARDASSYASHPAWGAAPPAQPPAWALLDALPIIGLIGMLGALAAWICTLNLAITAKVGNVCRRCGYDLAGLSRPVCPECGESQRDI